MIRHTVHFVGRVQGVGFRYTATRIARRFDVTGFVQNLPDGSVRLIAEGDADQVNDFIAAVRHEMNRHIKTVNVDESNATGEFENFDVRY